MAYTVTTVTHMGWTRLEAGRYVSHGGRFEITRGSSLDRHARTWQVHDTLKDTTVSAASLETAKRKADFIVAFAKATARYRES